MYIQCPFAGNEISFGCTERNLCVAPRAALDGLFAATSKKQVLYRNKYRHYVQAVCVQFRKKIKIRETLTRQEKGYQNINNGREGTSVNHLRMYAIMSFYSLTSLMLSLTVSISSPLLTRRIN